MPSSRPPPASTAEDTEPSGPAPRPATAAHDDAAHAAAAQAPALMAAAEALSSRGVFGVAWLDEALVIRATYGRLAEFLPIGVEVAEALEPLVGMQDDIRALATEAGSVLELPAVAIATRAADVPRLNLLLVWSHSQTRYLLMLSRPSTAFGLEAELSRQMRARLMAEAEVSAKSRELARANAELSQANRDLEDFASIIAHDLGAPMRAMRDMTERLESGIDAGVTGAGLETAVQGLKEQVARLSSMLRGLYEYSSIGRKQDAIEKVDTAGLVHRIARTTPHPEGFAIAIAGDWPQIDTLAAPLDLVLRNLIDNAVKHHDRADGRIEITGRVKGAVLEIVVADDGPGIPADHRAAAFLPFRTLAPQGAAATSGIGGTGMGLAFVKRTVEAIGGELTLASTPEINEGTRFTIVWPLMFRSTQ